MATPHPAVSPGTAITRDGAAPHGEDSMLLLASANVKTEPEHIRFLEDLLALSTTSQVAVRRWRVLISAELSILGLYLKPPGAEAPRVSKDEFAAWKSKLLACTIGHVEFKLMERGVSGPMYSVSVLQGRAEGRPDAHRLSTVKNEVAPEHLEFGVFQQRENIAAASECRFPSTPGSS
jgi:hypothetical protein